METAKKMPTSTGEVRDICQGPTEGGQCQYCKIRRETSGIPREAWDPTSKEERNEWNSKGSSGSKLKRREKRVESQGSLGSKLKRRVKQVESQGKLGIQTQKKKADHRTPEGIKTMETAKKMPTGTEDVTDICQGPTEGGRCQCRKIRRETI
jgi:hypothetical protein